MGVEGIDLKCGFTVPNIADGATKRALVRAAKRVICMADSTKLDTSYYYSIAPLSDADLIVTDHEADPLLMKRYADAGIRIVTTPRP